MHDAAPAAREEQRARRVDEHLEKHGIRTRRVDELLEKHGIRPKKRTRPRGPRDLPEGVIVRRSGCILRVR